MQNYDCKSQFHEMYTISENTIDVFKNNMAMGKANSLILAIYLNVHHQHAIAAINYSY